MIYTPDLERYEFADDDGWRAQLRDPSAKPFAYGMTCAPLKYQHWKATLADIPLRHPLYRPIPWEFQYDMECWIVFNYEHLWAAEKEALQSVIAKTLSPATREAAEVKLKAVELYGPTGLPRHEHLLRASELRWPTVKDGEGVWQGVAKRHEWPERIYAAALDPNWQTTPIVGVFGGGSQGKTTMVASLMLHAFSHFEGTSEGMHGVISTINEDKMNAATWPALLRMLDASASGISLYVGHEQARAGHVIGRKEMLNGVRTDKQATGSGTISGMLLGVHADRKASTDKLTGAHRKEAKVILVDEAQSSSDAPFFAIGNAFSSVKRGCKFFFYSGNFGTKHDTLGRNIQPIGGWNSVEIGTKVYDAKTQTKMPAKILHLNNMESPGLTNPEMYHDLFTHEKLRDQVPDETSWSSPAIVRMIKGWYDVETSSSSDALREETPIIDASELEAFGCFDRVVLDQATTSQFVVLDAAPEMRDRNVLSIFERGWCQAKEMNVFQPLAYSEMAEMVRSPAMASEYPRAFMAWTKQCIIDAGLDPTETQCYVDSAHYSLFAAEFTKERMPLLRMVYGAMPADPNRPKPDAYQQVERAFVVSPDNSYGHNTAADRISLGAWLLRQHVKHGSVAGLDPGRIAAAAKTPIDKDMELFRRTMFRIKNKERGSLWKLGTKAISDAGDKISPDWLDLWLMAAYYVSLTFGDVPGVPGERTEVRIPEIPESSVHDAWARFYGIAPRQPSEDIYDLLLA